MRTRSKLAAGDACRKCSAPVVKKSHDKPTRPNQRYWFREWLECPKCHTRYMIDASKVWVNA